MLCSDLDVVHVNTGLPWLASLPTRSILSHINECTTCGYTQEEFQTKEPKILRIAITVIPLND
jgi:hypothetical protein